MVAIFGSFKAKFSGTSNFDGTSFVTVNSVANGDAADVKAFAYQGSINKTAVAFWFGNHDPRTPSAASGCKLTFTVPYPHPHPYVMNVITGTHVPVSSYKRSQTGPNFLSPACQYQINP